MSDKITVLCVEPMCEPQIKEIEPGLKSLQKEVGGFIQAIYPYADPVALICNEEGKINELPLNRAVYDDDKNMTDIIAGTFLITGLGEDSFASLDKDLIKKYADMFRYPEQFFRIGGEIAAIPVKPSVRKQLDDAKTEQKPVNGQTKAKHKDLEV